MRDTVQAVVEAWRVGPVLSCRMPPSGTTHRTRLVRTASGRYALRGYRYTEAEPIQREHALIAFVRARGIPAIAPLPLPDGRTALDRAGRYFALFPGAPGRQQARPALTRTRLAAMGACLARIHMVLREYPADRVAPRSLAVERSNALARIARVVGALRARDPLPPDDAHCLRRLEQQRQSIARATHPPPDLSGLKQQIIHGDYQESNLFFAHGHVSAVIDWDQAYAAPRAWEVVRALDLVCGLHADLSRAFLDGYQQGAPLDITALALAAGWYGWYRLHDIWLYEHLNLEGAQRSRRFVPQGAFVPFDVRWAALWAALNTGGA